MSHLLLFILAIAPGIILLLLFMYMDRNEPEPAGFVVKMIALGALSCIPAIIVESLLYGAALFKIEGIAGAVYNSFLRIAWIEELCKLGVVLLFAWKNSRFNEENDGIVYTSASAIGFALFENVFYVLSEGFATGVARAVTAMPLHSFTGVIMGYFLGRARFSPDSHSRKQLIIKGFLIAYLAHAVYDSFALSGTLLGIMVIPLVIALVLFGVRVLKKGRALSLKRWEARAQDQAPPMSPSRTGSGTGAPSLSNWRIIVSRTLLTLSGLFWVLALWGVYNDAAQKKPIDPGNVVLGCVVITIIPVIAAILLERSHQKAQRKIA